MHTKKTIVVMPAYNAEKTIKNTVDKLPKIYSKILLCDDSSKDKTYETSKKLGITTLKHKKNKGYGANQKTLYNYALTLNPDVIIMVHPDDQYKTDCIIPMTEIINGKKADIVLGNRMSSARKHGMPLYKIISNKFLTSIQNIIFKTKLSEFHSGLRAYNAELLKEIPFNDFSDDFVFDSELIAHAIAYGKKIDQVDTECYYEDHVSSINLKRSLVYGIATLSVMGKYFLGFFNKKIK